MGRGRPPARGGGDLTERVLIAGCGDVGTALALRLVADGHEVWGLRRDPSGLPAPIRPLAADLARPETLHALPDGLAAVCYAAAADRSDDDAYRTAYVDGLRHVLDALRARRAPLRRVLFVSSTAVYAQTDGSWVDETSPAEATGFAGERLRQGEALVRAAGIPGVVARLGGIYGPGRGRLLAQLRAGQATCTDGPPRWVNRIHRDDCAGALRHLLALPDPDPVWLAVDDEPADQCTVLDWLADRLALPRPPRVPPPAAGEGRARSHKRCANRKLVASGYTFRYPTFRDGYGAILASG